MSRESNAIPIGEYMKGVKQNKYGVSPKADRTFDGKVYASKYEMERAKELRQGIACEVFREVIEQPRVSLGCRENIYVPDFIVIGQTFAWFEDVKGHSTAAFNKNKKLWAKYGRLPLHILTRKGSGWDTEIIEPQGDSR